MNKNIIIFPPYIENIAISFVQGFTDQIFSEIEKGQFYNYFEIQGSKRVVDKFERSIYF